MVSKSLVAVKDKSSEPELEGDIRTTVWDSASARQAVEGEDDQMSAGDLAALLRQPKACDSHEEFNACVANYMESTPDLQ